MEKFKKLFGNEKVIIGMVHLMPLPGSPNFKHNIDEIYRNAMKDLKTLEAGGADGVIIENFGDIPYSTNNPIETYLTMTHIVTLLRKETEMPMGVNIQFNCGKEELAVAHVCNADFIRVEAFVENRIGAHGITYAQAPDIMRYRSKMESNVLIFSDINVKHTYPLTTSEDIILNLNEAISAGADAIIVTGIGTGKQPSIEEVEKLKSHMSEIPLLVGSGVSKNNIKDFLDVADGVIVGTSIKEDGDVKLPISLEKVKALVETVKIK